MAQDARTTRGSATARVVKAVDELSPKGRRTRTGLIESALRVFERDGFIDVRVDDIVTEAGVSHGTFYTYFSSKEEIFRAVIEQHQSIIEQSAHRAITPHGASARTRIEASNRAYLEGYARHSRLMELWAEAAVLHPELADLLEELSLFNIERTERFLRHLKATGAIADDVEPEYAAKALNAMVMQFAIRLFRDDPEDVDVDTAVRTVTDLWCRGISLDESG